MNMDPLDTRYIPPPPETGDIQVKDGILKIGGQKYAISLTRGGEQVELNEKELKALTRYAAAILGDLGEDLAAHNTEAINIRTGDDGPEVKIGSSAPAKKLEDGTHAFAIAEQMDKAVEKCFERIAAEHPAPVTTTNPSAVVVRPVDEDEDEAAVEEDEPIRHEFESNLTKLSDTYSEAALKERVDNTADTANKFLDALENQYGGTYGDDDLTDAQKDDLNEWAKNRLPDIKKRYTDGFSKFQEAIKKGVPAQREINRKDRDGIFHMLFGRRIGRKEVEPGFKKNVEDFHNRLALGCYEAERKMLIEVASKLTDGEVSEKKLARAVDGRMFAGEEAKKAVKKARRLMNARADRLQKAHATGKGQAAKDRAELENCYQGVSAQKDATFVQPMFRFLSVKKQKKCVKNQLNALMTARLSPEDRGIIKHEGISIHGHQCSSRQTPLNGRFDERLPDRKKGTPGPMAEVFGNEGGVSAGELACPHLKNAYDSSFEGENGTAVRGIRHGVIGRNNPDQQAKELLAAAVVSELADLGLSAEAAADRDKPIEVTLTSVSLLSPASKETKKPNYEGQKVLWAEQRLALRNLRGEQEITIQGHKVKVKVSVIPFNFGVNQRNVEKQHYGVKQQFKNNGDSDVNLRGTVRRYFEDMQKAVGSDPDLGPILEKVSEEADVLLTDIKGLLRDQKAYLQGQKGGNQYEVGAKILCLMSLMDNFRNEVIEKEPDIEGLPGGFKNAFNGMSGDDQTGVMDAMAKALAFMRDKNGEWPTHEQFEKDANLRLEFAEVYVRMMAEGGGLEVTKHNKGSHGYHVFRHSRPWHKDDAMWKKAVANVAKELGGDKRVMAGLLGLGGTIEG